MRQSACETSLRGGIEILGFVIGLFAGSIAMLVCIGIVSGNGTDEKREEMRQIYRKGFDRGLKEGRTVEYARGWQDGRESIINYAEKPDYQALRAEFELEDEDDK